jgi:hypothetical protein
MARPLAGEDSVIENPSVTFCGLTPCSGSAEEEFLDLGTNDSACPVTRNLAAAYAAGKRVDKSRMLDQICGRTGWSRDHARRRLRMVLTCGDGQGQSGSSGRSAALQRKKYSDTALAILEQVWRASGRQCGKYLAVAMPVLLDNLERHGHLPGDLDQAEARAELLAMSPATIDRHLARVRSHLDDADVRGNYWVNNLRGMATLRQTAVGLDEPGFFCVQVVRHAPDSLDSGRAHTVNLVDAATGWVSTCSIADDPLGGTSALIEAVEQVPFLTVGLDIDDAGSLHRPTLKTWAASSGIGLNSCALEGLGDNDVAPSGSRQPPSFQTVVAPHAATDSVVILNRLWSHVNDWLNYFTPTKKPIGWESAAGRQKRVYDSPATPFDRLLRAQVLSSTQEDELRERRNGLDVCELAREVLACQEDLLSLTTGADGGLD